MEWQEGGDSRDVDDRMGESGGGGGRQPPAEDERPRRDAGELDAWVERTVADVVQQRVESGNPESCNTFAATQ